MSLGRVGAETSSTHDYLFSDTFAARKELHGSIIVNPYNMEEIATAIRIALEMPVSEQKQRITMMQNHLKEHDVFRWGLDFISQLLKAFSPE